MGQNSIDSDTLYDRPITCEGADLVARRYGFRLVGFMPPLAADRILAVFLPEPDDGGAAIIADGRTQSRALRRGLDLCAAIRTSAPGADPDSPRDGFP